MHDTRLIFVEGVMGSGKSTTASFIARQLRRNGVAAEYVWEGGERHPLRMMSHVPRPFAPWLDYSVASYRERSLELWRALVESAGPESPIAVCDGQLFHGNLTDLLLMDAKREELAAYISVCYAEMPSRIVDYGRAGRYPPAGAVCHARRSDGLVSLGIPGSHDRGSTHGTVSASQRERS